MELFFVSFIIILFTLLNSLSYIVGALKTAPGMVFLGTVHYPLDYFYYLSQIIQGQTNWLFSYHLQTGEFTPKILIGWVYVLSGRLLSFFSPIAIYQLLVAIFSIIFLLSSYLLISRIFPNSFKKRVLAFILFVTTNGFPKIINQGKLTFGFYDAWSNYGFPFIRLSSVPHHLFIQILTLLTLTFIITFLSRKINPGRAALLFLVLGLLTSSLQPAQWSILTVTFFMTVILFSHFFSHRDKHASLLSSRLFRFLPAAIFTTAGIPSILYLKQIFRMLPFSQAIAWETTQQLHLPLADFILVNGPLVFLSICGFLFFIRRMSTAKMVITLYTFLSLGIFFSPLPQKAAILNVRFLSPVYVLFFACISTDFISRIKKPALQYALVFMILLLSLPPFFLQMKARLTFNTSNAYYYLPSDALTAYREAKNLSTAKDIFLVLWPFELSFPGLTGRRVFFGNEFSTISYETKVRDADRYFSGKFTEEEARKFLKENNITFVLAYPWTFPSYFPALTRVYQNNFLTVYKVL